MPIDVNFNATRYQPGQQIGHYESFFQRANHPTEPRAFWIRYTSFSPQGRPEAAVGELWAVYFDGVSGNHTAVRQEFQMADYTFDPAQLGARIGTSSLAPGELRGSASLSDHTISWDLSFRGTAAPIFTLPPRLYETGFPKAKSLVGLPLATYSGRLMIDGNSIEITDWVGSQNHNWGSKHTDDYAWGQVAGFDGSPDSFLEVATVRIKLGVVWTPPLTPLVLRHGGEELRLNSLLQMVRAKASRHDLEWQFKSETALVRIEGTISAERSAFVGLRYANPPGGSKICLNSKIAACDLRITRKPSGQMERLVCKNRAAFEILTDTLPPGMTLVIDPQAS